MARRKKEPEAIHRAKMAEAAERLFMKKGTEAATMDEIAKEAGYSKATLYVYFKNKEEIIGYLVLRSMNMLHEYLRGALSEHAGTKEKYLAVCLALARYQERYPAYFEFVLGEINVDFKKPESLPVERETFETGEKIKEEIVDFLKKGMEEGELRTDFEPQKTVFMFWSMLSGLIRTASKKRSYIEQFLGVTAEEFLDGGFELLYRSIRAGSVTDREREMDREEGV